MSFLAINHHKGDWYTYSYNDSPWIDLKQKAVDRNPDLNQFIADLEETFSTTYALGRIALAFDGKRYEYDHDKYVWKPQPSQSSSNVIEILDVGDCLRAGNFVIPQSEYINEIVWCAMREYATQPKNINMIRLTRPGGVFEWRGDNRSRMIPCLNRVGSDKGFAGPASSTETVEVRWDAETVKVRWDAQNAYPSPTNAELEAENAALKRRVQDLEGQLREAGQPSAVDEVKSTKRGLVIHIDQTEYWL